jgi:hypothetical protein
MRMRIGMGNRDRDGVPSPRLSTRPPASGPGVLTAAAYAGGRSARRDRALRWGARRVRPVRRPPGTRMGLAGRGEDPRPARGARRHRARPARRVQERALCSRPSVACWSSVACCSPGARISPRGGGSAHRRANCTRQHASCPRGGRPARRGDRSPDQGAAQQAAGADGPGSLASLGSPARGTPATRWAGGALPRQGQLEAPPGAPRRSASDRTLPRTDPFIGGHRPTTPPVPSRRRGRIAPPWQTG